MLLTPNDITCVILAGGQGKRLGGVDKGLALLQGQPLIEHVLNKLRPQCPRILLNANRNLATYRRYGLTVLKDLDSGYLGPLSGLYSTLSQISSDWLLCAPCDAPDLPDNYVQLMLSRAEPERPVVVSLSGRLQPTFSLTPKACLGALRDYLDRGERAAGHWFLQQQCIAADFSEQARHFSNLNDNNDLQSWGAPT